jgi:hypothetical protein
MRQADEVRRLIAALNQRRQYRQPGRPASAPESDVAGKPAGQGRPGPRVDPDLLLGLLYSHEPFLACVVDPQWNLLASNYMLELLVGPVAPGLLVPPINVLRLVLHPDGMAARLANLTEVHAHLLRRLRRQVFVVGTESLVRLEREVAGYRAVPTSTVAASATGPIAMPVRLWVGSTLVNLISTAVFFGTPWEASTTTATAECLFPADEATRDFLFACQPG